LAIEPKRNDPGLDLFGSGHFEGKFQRTVFEFFVFLARVPAVLPEIIERSVVKVFCERRDSTDSSGCEKDKRWNMKMPNCYREIGLKM